jgi:ribosomal protein S18 acetylase RimI-like enzyme
MVISETTKSSMISKEEPPYHLRRRQRQRVQVVRVSAQAQQAQQSNKSKSSTSTSAASISISTFFSTSFFISILLYAINFTTESACNTSSFGIVAVSAFTSPTHTTHTTTHTTTTTTTTTSHPTSAAAATTTVVSSRSRSVGRRHKTIGISDSGGGDGEDRRGRLITLLSSSSSQDSSSSSSSSSSQQTTAEKEEEENTNIDTNIANIEYKIRDCTYKELNQVASLMITGFYDITKMNIMSKKFTEIAELNRLQQSYPGSSSANNNNNNNNDINNNNNNALHRMLIVEAIVTKTTKSTKSIKSKSEIVGFCDVDCRPYNIQLKVKLPRPYISDLTIDNNHRRKGLAKQLVEESEKIVTSIKNNRFNDIWIRVEDNNQAAIELYQNSLGYKITNWSTETGTSNTNSNSNSTGDDDDDEEEDSVSDTTTDAIKIWTLRKILRDDYEEDDGN